MTRPGRWHQVANIDALSTPDYYLVVIQELKTTVLQKIRSFWKLYWPAQTYGKFPLEKGAVNQDCAKTSEEIN